MLNLSFSDLMHPTAAGWAVLLGILLHVLVFRVGEWDLFTVQLIGLSVSFFVGLAAIFVAFVPEIHGSVWTAFKGTALFESSILGGIYLSMAVYRVGFHRLNRFPGPVAARLSNMWITGKSIGNVDKYLHIQKLHESYGDIVRIGTTR